MILLIPVLSAMLFCDEDGLKVINLGRKTTAPRLFSLAAFFIIAAVIFISTLGNASPISVDEAISITEGWACSWLDSHETAIKEIPSIIPGGYAGRTLHISNTLPSMSFFSPSLMIRTSQQHVTVLLNSVPIYEFTPGNPGKAPGSMYHFITLPSGYEGGRLDIYLSSPLDQFSGIINEVRIGPITSHILYILNMGSTTLFLAAVAITLGFILLAFYLSMYSDGSRHSGILHMALFIILSGLWMCSESRTIKLFVRNPLLIMCTSFMSQYLAPVPFIAFVVNTYNPRHSKWLKAFMYIFAINFLILSGLYLLGLAEFFSTAVLFHATLLFCVAIFILTAFNEMRRGKKSARSFFLGCILLCLSICADIFRYYFLFPRWVVKPIIYRYGLFIFIITTSASMAHHIFVTHEEKVSHDILLSLAFTDTLTGFKNRRSFDDRMADINENLDSYSSVHLVILDINGLKKVNDTLGHREGDQLIIEVARLIRETLGHLGEIFRIGGDEFVALITNIEPYFIRVELETLNKKIEAFNEGEAPFRLSIAYGLATYSREHDRNLHDVFERADKTMYICKENQKGMQIIKVVR